MVPLPSPIRKSNRRSFRNISRRWTIQQTGRAGEQLTRSGQHIKYAVEGVYNGTKMRVIVQGNDIITAFPIE